MDMLGLTVHPRLRPLSSPFAAVYLVFSTYFINFIAGIFRFPPVCGISHKTGCKIGCQDILFN